MATRNIVPRADGEGSLGTQAKKWGNLYANAYNGISQDLLTKAITHVVIDTGKIKTDQFRVVFYQKFADGIINLWGYWNAHKEKTLTIPLPFEIKEMVTTFGCISGYPLEAIWYLDSHATTTSQLCVKCITKENIHTEFALELHVWGYWK